MLYSTEMIDVYKRQAIILVQMKKFNIEPLILCFSEIWGKVLFLTGLWVKTK